MDAGNGLHAGQYGKDRIMLHINIASSTYYNSGFPPNKDLYDRFLFNGENRKYIFGMKWIRHISK